MRDMDFTYNGPQLDDERLKRRHRRQITAVVGGLVLAASVFILHNIKEKADKDPTWTTQTIPDVAVVQPPQEIRSIHTSGLEVTYIETVPEQIKDEYDHDRKVLVEALS